MQINLCGSTLFFEKWTFFIILANNEKTIDVGLIQLACTHVTGVQKDTVPHK